MTLNSSQGSRKLSLWLLAGGCLLIAAGAQRVLADTAQYTLSKQYATVLFKVQHQSYAKLVGRFDDFSGTLSFDPADIGSSRLEASVNMSSLNMADGDLVETLVHSSTWFNADLYPQATFRTREVKLNGDRDADFIGELSFMGLSRPWTLSIHFNGGGSDDLSGSTVGIEATGSFKRSDFGLDQYMNMAADLVEIEVHTRFKRD
ncbi:MAG: YceI family protein [Pseudomonadales bacterium]|nr:YceI family protein [Pseudomonadales bacterium]